jgi:integrase
MGLKLTDKGVVKLACPPDKKDALMFDSDLKGFGVRITAGGRRIFLFQYRAGAKVRRQVIGEFPTTTTAAARKRAEQLRGVARGGADPVAERNAKREAERAADRAKRERKATVAFTVDRLIDEWQAEHLSKRSASYRQEAPRRLRAALGGMGDRPAAEVDRAEANAALRAAVATAGRIGVNRVRAYARACFAWGVRELRIPSSPFADLATPGDDEEARDRFLDDAELARVWRAAGGIGEQWRAIVRLLILTGQRRGEVAGMGWSEISPDLTTWVIPAARSKNGRKHEVPLAPAAAEIIRATPRFAGCDLVFSQGRKTPPSGFGRAKERLDGALSDPPISPWTLHDLRRTVATGLQRAGVRLEVTEAVLNHVSGTRSGIVGVYQRHAWTAEKGAALEDWARHVLRCGEKDTAPDADC